RGPEPHVEAFDGKDRLGHGSYLSFGSSASRRPSPMKLKQNSVSAMKGAGKTSAQGAVSICCAPSEISTPQEVKGSRMPSPKNDRKVSARITPGIVSVT